ncbi:16S rRNA (guanine(966)-N(2))-methyltransferase RsmD [Paenibacillus xylaniclasticus]|uniref:16S rRNA (guanine(966)-N(2))-methyltransferase RsmD n=1 Tax=Paenibacillus xylaniclasticus TaxID=588083 RepID=UPI000FD9C5A3|nr:MULTISPECIES: 16S rRNA (guanine(966)-N(2))-methyltransferase RsmD [Paenibacillus]GFN31940.1 rRNA methyltransferase [Paenibacillus curdlanolyticus]
MRVIAGSAKGRPLKAVPGMNTRPTTDKVKEAIFSMIGPFFDGGLVLDLFAGTGGLGIEALSRGADRAIFVDKEKQSVDVVRHNTTAAGVGDRSEIYRNDAQRAIKALAKRGQAFRLVFLDPPYRMTNMDEMLEEIATAGLLEDGASIVVEHDAAHVYPEQFGGFKQRKSVKYGDTAVTIYSFRQLTTEPANGNDGGEEHDEA